MSDTTMHMLDADNAALAARVQKLQLELDAATARIERLEGLLAAAEMARAAAIKQRDSWWSQAKAADTALTLVDNYGQKRVSEIGEHYAPWEPYNTLEQWIAMRRKIDAKFPDREVHP